MAHLIVSAIQKASFHGPANLDAPRPTAPILYDGELFCDVSYGSCLPNSFVDIYKSKRPLPEPTPLVVYVHGGGYTWGDKRESGDPEFWVFRRYLDAGYHVVSVNYALSPDHTYPTPVRQLDECMTFLIEHGYEYGISTEGVILVGGSAGAHLTGQYANFVTNPGYAGEVGIHPVLKKSQLKAYVSGCGLLDCERFDRTGSLTFDIILRACARAYFRCRKVQGDPRVVQAGVISHLTSDFPPFFAFDGNYGTFTDQAIDMKRRGDELGIRCELLLIPKEEARLGHGYENERTPSSEKTMDLVLKFLDEVV